MSNTSLLPGRAVFTIAFGKPIYFTMAFALARSFLRHNRGNGIDFVLVTDRPVSARPADLAVIRWVEVPSGAYGRGFSPKLHLDKLAPAERSMFVDSDCLCVGSLEPAFEVFAGHKVSVVGKRISDGEWFGDVTTIRQKFGLEAYPRFNGGVYYIEPGETARRVYETARAIEPRYDEIGFVRLRGSPNDEVCMAIALEQHGQTPVPDTGTIMNTLIEARSGMIVDVLRGEAVLRNDLGASGSDAFYENAEMRPVLVHFCGLDVANHPYRTQVLLLHLVDAAGWSPTAARGWVAIRSILPFKAVQILKNALRPAYRALFGVRTPKPTSRLQEY